MNTQINANSEVVKEVYKNGNNKIKKALEKIFSPKIFQPDIMKRINNFHDICKEMGKNPKDYICNSDDPDDQAANAYKMALLIVKCYNEDIVLDWNNPNQIKYCLRYYLSGSGWSLYGVVIWDANTHCGARLHFAKKEHAQDAWDKFKEVFIKLN
ncbi:hypothetical protein [Flavobacterium mekongense]|uniref:hypothetical protein n=1 Tax=Flavobacterium mekongense TaxID=3379707 RepID=UPI00399957F4